MKHWYALYTKPHKEQRVCSSLESKGFETYLPTVKIRKNGNYKVRPFLSCYLFVRVDHSNGLFSLRWTPGLRRVVSSGDQPVVAHTRVGFQYAPMGETSLHSSSSTLANPLLGRPA